MKIYEITGYYPTGGATPIDVIDKVNQKIQPVTQLLNTFKIIIVLGEKQYLHHISDSLAI